MATNLILAMTSKVNQYKKFAQKSYGSTRVRRNGCQGKF